MLSLLFELLVGIPFDELELPIMDPKLLIRPGGGAGRPPPMDVELASPTILEEADEDDCFLTPVEFSSILNWSDEEPPPRSPQPYREADGFWMSPGLPPDLRKLSESPAVNLLSDPSGLPPLLWPILPALPMRFSIRPLPVFIDDEDDDEVGANNHGFDCNERPPMAEDDDENDEAASRFLLLFELSLELLLQS